MSTPAIDAFWAWWSTGPSEAFARGFDRKEPLPPELITAISERVEAIHGDLDWEFGAGHASRHHLCLSSKGDPVLRVITERWVKRGPKADATWEYYPARQAARTAELELTIEDQRISLALLAFEVTSSDTRENLSVVAYHPAFEGIADEDLRRRIAFIGLDNLLGEDKLERWIGAVEVTAKPPVDAVGYHDLAARVDAVAASATGQKWTILQGAIEGRPIFVTTNRAIKRVDHLLLDMHVSIEVKLLAPTDEGLTSNDEAEALHLFEDELVAALGEHAVPIGRETWDGRRTIHLHVGEGGPARAILDRVIARHPTRTVKIETRMDPRWEILDRWG